MKKNSKQRKKHEKTIYWYGQDFKTCDSHDNCSNETRVNSECVCSFSFVKVFLCPPHPRPSSHKVPNCCCDYNPFPTSLQYDINESEMDCEMKKVGFDRLRQRRKMKGLRKSPSVLVETGKSLAIEAILESYNFTTVFDPGGFQNPGKSSWPDISFFQH